jgi:hypothetical protein
VRRILLTIDVGEMTCGIKCQHDSRSTKDGHCSLFRGVRAPHRVASWARLPECLAAERDV